MDGKSLIDWGALPQVGISSAFDPLLNFTTHSSTGRLLKG